MPARLAASAVFPDNVETFAGANADARAHSCSPAPVLPHLQLILLQGKLNTGKVLGWQQLLLACRRCTLRGKERRPPLQ